MKLLIVGSRSITNFDISPYIPDDVELIISGGAKGIDTLAEQYADKMKISKLILRPDYKNTNAAHHLKGMRKWSICVTWCLYFGMAFQEERSILLTMQGN